MYYVNNFRFGEISRRNAGRFDTEAYSQGSFSFINALSLTEGGFTRRPPLKQIYEPRTSDPSVDSIFRLIPFNISESISFLVGIADSSINIYQNINGRLVFITSSSYPSTNEETVGMTKTVANTMCYCQYYNRMYFASQSFRPFYIDFDLTSSRFTTSFVTLILNQDAKNMVKFTPARILDENGNELTKFQNRPVFTGPDGKYYFDRDMQEMYLYANTYPPVNGSNKYIMNYDSFADSDLLKTKNDYPAVVSIVFDSLYFASTKNAPGTLWKSRILGSSQWVKDYSYDSLHDFSCFQLVMTDSTDLVDEEDIPMKDATGPDGNVYYEMDGNGNPKYFVCKKENNKVVYGVQIYKDYKAGADSTKYYTSSDCTVEYRFASGEYADKKPMRIYDLTDASKLLTTKATLDYVCTDSCGCRFSLNTGRQDRIIYIKSALERIIVGTSTSEFTLPSSFSAVKNLNSSNLYDFGSANLQPVTLNASLVFLQKDNLLRELYLYEGYVNHSEITAYSKEVINGNVVSMSAKNTPNPMIYILMDDGTLRVVSYDKEMGIQSFSRWDSELRIESIATIDNTNSQIMCALVSMNGHKTICYFDENEKDHFKDLGTYMYRTEVETVYAEIIDNSLTFGRFKKAKVMWIRPYETGFMMLGSDRRQLTKTRCKLGNNDYRHTNMGISTSQFSVVMQSVDDEPMTILALSWEVDNGV